MTRTTTRPVAAGGVTTRASTTPGTPEATRVTVACGRRGGGDERGCGGAGPVRGDEHVVAVAAGVALVDDVGAGHAEVHAERGGDERAEDDEPDGEHAAGPAQRDAGDALPAGLGGDVPIFGVLLDEDTVAERDQQSGQQCQRCERRRRRPTGSCRAPWSGTP